MLEQNSPPFLRRGGCTIKKMVPFLSGEDGVVVMNVAKRQPTRLRPYKGMGIFPDGAATPP
jgi:hypothetical protein